MNPRSACRAVSLFSCISQFAEQPWKDDIQTTRAREGAREGLFTTFYADASDVKRLAQGTFLLLLMIGVAERASFGCTAGGIIFWVEVQDNSSPFEVSQVHLAIFHHIIASHRRKRKIRSRLLLFGKCIAHRNLLL